jgi:hypothetical protein
MSLYEDRLRKFFRNDKFWAIVENTFVAYEPEGWNQLDAIDRILTRRGIMSVEDWNDYLTEFQPHDELRSKLSEIYEVIVEKLGHPIRITADELAGITIAQLAGLSWTNPDESSRLEDAKSRVEAFAIAECRMERVGEKRFSCGRFVPVLDGQFEESLAEFEIWSSPEQNLKLYAEAQSCNDIRDCYDVTAFLMGRFSTQALPIVEASLAPVVTSAVKTLTFAATVSDKSQGQPTEMEKNLEILFALGDEPGEIIECRYSPDRFFLPLSYLTKADGQRMIQAMISAYFHADQSGSDSLMERLRNAVLLLAHADQLAAEPLALSTIFAAIEALVCEEHLPVTQQIKKHVTTLLIPDAASRKSRESLIGKLYKIRCGVMHGSRIEGSSEASKSVRRIAAGVIRAVVCWRENQRRVGGITTWKELMDELNAASRKPDIVVGVPDLTELIPDKLSA